MLAQSQALEALVAEKWRPFVGPLSESAVLTAMAAINSLMRYLVDAGYLLGNPLGLIRQRRRKMFGRCWCCKDDIGGLGAQVDGRTLYPRHRRQGPFGPRDARGATHALKLKSDGLAHGSYGRCELAKVKGDQDQNPATGRHLPSPRPLRRTGRWPHIRNSLKGE